MTLIKLFNKMLQELPEISINLQNAIEREDWPEKRKKQAKEIVQQIQKSNMIEAGSGYSGNYANLKNLTIVLETSECGINSTTFGRENIAHADKYVKDLLADINEISSYISFNFGGHYYTGEKCEFDISWEF